MVEIVSVNQVKQHNVDSIIRALRSVETGTKNDMSRITGLSVATCNTILNELAETGQILPVQNDAPSIGRPPKLFRYNETYSYICCIYFHHSGDQIFMHYAVTDLLGHVMEEHTEYIPSIDLSILIDRVQTMREKYNQISNISVGIPGYYHNNRICSGGRMILEGCDLIAELNKVFPCKIHVENDVNAMAYGIYFYREDIVKKNENLVLVAVVNKDGLGSGTIINGKILHGETAFAGEVLHLNYPEGKCEDLLYQGGEGVLAVASRIVIAFSAIINPAVIVFTGDNISEDYLPVIRERALPFISEQNMPRMVYKSNFEKYYIQGLSAIALDWIYQH